MTNYSEKDYANALFQLLPEGILWECVRETDTDDTHQLLSALATHYKEAGDRICKLFVEEAFFDTTQDALAIWERKYGIETSVDEDTAQRRSKLLGHIVEGRGKDHAFAIWMQLQPFYLKPHYQAFRYQVGRMGHSQFGSFMHTKNMHVSHYLISKKPLSEDEKSIVERLREAQMEVFLRVVPEDYVPLRCQSAFGKRFYNHKSIYYYEKGETL